MWLENKTWTRPIEWTRGAQSEIFCFDSFLSFAARALSPADGWRVGCVAVPPRTSCTNWGESWSPESLETDNIRRHTVQTVVPPIPCGPARAERLARDQIALERTLTLIKWIVYYVLRPYAWVRGIFRSLAVLYLTVLHGLLSSTASGVGRTDITSFLPPQSPTCSLFIPDL